MFEHTSVGCNFDGRGGAATPARPSIGSPDGSHRNKEASAKDVQLLTLSQVIEIRTFLLPACQVRNRGVVHAHDSCPLLLASTPFDQKGRAVIVSGNSVQRIDKAQALEPVAEDLVFNKGSIHDCQTQSARWTSGASSSEGALRWMY